MRAQLDDLRARGDALALLWAIESGIYGRYGYGVATRARTVRVRASRAALRPQAPAGGTVRVLDRAEIVPVLSAVHDTLALRRPGGITRTPGWWEGYADRHADDALLAAVHTDEDGTDDGFAVGVAGGPGPFGPDGGGYTLHVEDLHAADTAAAAGLWRFLLGVDLIAHVEACRAGGRPAGAAARRSARRRRHRAGRRDVAAAGRRARRAGRALVPGRRGAAAARRARPAAAGQRRGLPDRGGGRRARRSAGRLRAGAVVRRRRARAGLPRRPQPVRRWPRRAGGRCTTRTAPARADALFATAPAPWCGTHF